MALTKSQLMRESNEDVLRSRYRALMNIYDLRKRAHKVRLTENNHVKIACPKDDFIYSAEPVPAYHGTSSNQWPMLATNIAWFDSALVQRK